MATWASVRATRLSLIVIGLVLGAPNARAEDQEIALNERRLLLLAVLAPADGFVDRNAVIDAITRRIEAKTDLEVEAINAERTSECRGDMLCLMERVNAAGTTTARPTPYLLLIGVTLGQDGGRISATLLDLEEARRVQANEASRSKEDIQAAINETAMLVSPRRTEISNLIDLEVYLDRLMTQQLEPALDRGGALRPFGNLLVQRLPSGTEVALDGVALGVSRAPNVRIRDIHAGDHQLSLAHPDYLPSQLEVTIEREKTTTLAPVLSMHAGERGMFRDVTFWSGAGVAALGTGVTVFAMAAGGPNTQRLCITTSPAGSRCSQGAEFRATGQVARTGGEIDRRGFLIAPLGYSLALAGLTTSVLVMVFDDDRRAPWLEIALGVAAGMLVYGASAAFDGG